MRVRWMASGCWRRAILQLGIPFLILGCPLPGAAASRERTLAGEVGIERFHTADLFPAVGVRQPDWGVRATLKGSAGLSVGDSARVIEWVKLVAERYDVLKVRDLERWTLGTDLRWSRYRLRVYGERTNHELAFPVVGTDGAILDRSAVGGDLRVELWPGWRADVKADYERQDYVRTFDERDGHVWVLRTGLEQRLGGGRSLLLSHEYRRARSVTRLYSFEQNALRGLVDWRLPWSVSTEVEGQLGLRNYRTGQAFATNFGRSDDRALVTGTVGHALAGPVRVEMYGEWRHRKSTRGSKNYDVSTFGIALTANSR